jgi:hypothetical protein
VARRLRSWGRAALGASTGPGGAGWEGEGTRGGGEIKVGGGWVRAGSGGGLGRPGSGGRLTWAPSGLLGLGFRLGFFLSFLISKNIYK